ncbi:hypothetical protein LTR85_002684 [Meristemomyces frigidus]|nr:hypothetical protein LTR85_002684 [Meristemomyces frigidus]
MESCVRVLPASPQSSDGRPPCPVSPFDDFQHLPKYQVLVCKRHGYAVPNLQTHLATYHRDPIRVRRTVVAHFAQVELVAPELARLPAPYGPPIAGLSASRRGYRCTDEGGCPYVTTCRKEIAKHCNQAHGWRSRGGDRMYWDEVRKQSFSTTPGRQRWFIVRGQSEAVVVEVRRGEELSDVDEILQEFAELDAQHRKTLEKADEP